MCLKKSQNLADPKNQPNKMFELKWTKKKSIKKVRGEGGLASLAKKDRMNTRLRFSLTNHVVGVLKKKRSKSGCV